MLWKWTVKGYLKRPKFNSLIFLPEKLCLLWIIIHIIYELFARKIHLRENYMCHYCNVIRKGYTMPLKYHRFRMLSNKKVENTSLDRKLHKRHTTSYCRYILISVHHLLHFQVPQLILGWLSSLKVSYVGKSKRYWELTLPSSRGI